ncbi:MAG: hypothetical protein QM398_06275 [Thermoproteota archaeon]|jgi:hypothetical protein|nr:hypothetical protein [Thermoproteota archaeon]
MISKETLLQSALLIGILAFALSSVQMITVVYTVTPFAFFGVPITVNVNMSLLLVACAIIFATILVWRKQKK